jgi:AraC-like DNA-binding protein
MLVKEELQKLGLHFVNVELGSVEIMENMTQTEHDQLKTALLRSGLELMDDRKSILIERIQNIITEMVHYTDDLPKTNFSDFLAEKLDYNYTYLANIFSETKGITIEHYIILHKIERVKELIIYNELSLSEIAWKLHYSSVAHLSTQFKKVTGLTPSFFKSLRHKKRLTLEDV